MYTLRANFKYFFYLLIKEFSIWGEQDTFYMSIIGVNYRLALASLAESSALAYFQDFTNIQ